MSRSRFRSADARDSKRSWARFLQGAIVGAVIAVVSLIAGAAFAGSGIGGVFNLGQSNSVNANTTLTGATTGPQLSVNNTSTGTGASGVSIQTATGKPPLVVNSNTQVANLNASLLGGLKAGSQLQLRVSGTCSNGEAVTAVGGFGNVICSSTAGRLIYQTVTNFQGPWDTTTQASFTVPAGLMCVSGQASAYTTTPGGGTLGVQFISLQGAPSLNFELLANEANSHKTLVPQWNNNCVTVSAGTYSYLAQEFDAATSDNNDVGSISVQVFSQ
jgi:hypothetical protein